MSVGELIKEETIDACGEETDVLYALIGKIPTVPPEDSKVKISKSLSKIRIHVPEAATLRNLDIIRAYANAAEELAIKGENPSEYIDAAKTFIRDCTREERKKYFAEMSLIKSIYYLESGDVEAYMAVLTELTDPNSGIPKEVFKAESSKLIAHLRKYVKS